MTWDVVRSESFDYLRREAPDCSVDSVVTDPPYELNFMGKGWDKSGVANSVDFWREILRVLKPGGHLAAFGGTRTYHRMACAIEDAGFEIRDSIHWFYGQGFPKSLDVAKAMQKADKVAPREVRAATLDMASNPQWNAVNNQLVMPEPVAGSEAARWEGWGTALKPAHEPIVLARKPLEGTVVQNVRKWGTGAINVDGCRIGTEQRSFVSKGIRPGSHNIVGDDWRGNGEEKSVEGRWPANVVLSHDEDCVPLGTSKIRAITGTAAGRMAGDQTGVTFGEYAGSERAGERTGFGDEDGNETVEKWACVPGCPVRVLDDQTGTSVSRKGKPRSSKEPGEGWGMTATGAEYEDSGGASRFFYCAKPARSEKDAGCSESGVPPKHRRGDAERKDPFYNDHPTVKPVSLMRWLVRLLTPPGGLVVDPFGGSGTTGVASVLEGFDFLGIDRDEDEIGRPLGYCEIARARIAWTLSHREDFEK